MVDMNLVDTDMVHRDMVDRDMVDRDMVDTEVNFLQGWPFFRGSCSIWVSHSGTLYSSSSSSSLLYMGDMVDMVNMDMVDMVNMDMVDIVDTYLQKG